MRFLKAEQWEVLDEVVTESTILRLLREDTRSSSLDFDICDFNWADCINQKGLEYTQQHINKFRSSCDDTKKLVFICQHISVNRLGWGDSIVFTPHASHEDTFYAIPHYSVHAGKYRPIREKHIKASFVGSFETHACRVSSTMTLENREDCITKDTGAWHFHNSNRLENEKLYRKTLEDTQISLCPRGTGPSTIRLWESMSFGCLPLLITDSLKMPLSDLIDWDAMILRIQPHMSPLVSNMIDAISCDEIDKKAKLCNDVYQEKFSNDNLHVTVLENLRRIQHGH